MAWVFSKSKVLLFTTQQLTSTVAFVTFGDVIKYQNNSSCCQFSTALSWSRNCCVCAYTFCTKICTCAKCLHVASSLVTWFATWSSFGQKWRKKKKRSKESERKDRSTVRDSAARRNLKVPSAHSFPCPSSLSSMPHHLHHTSHLIHTPHRHCFSHSFFLPFLFFNHKVTRKVSPVRQAFSFNDTEKSGEALASPAGERGVSTCACILPCPSVCRWSKWLDPVSGLINERPVGSRTSYQSRH